MGSNRTKKPAEAISSLGCCLGGHMETMNQYLEIISNNLSQGNVYNDCGCNVETNVYGTKKANLAYDSTALEIQINKIVDESGAVTDDYVVGKYLDNTGVWRNVKRRYFKSSVGDTLLKSRDTAQALPGDNLIVSISTTSTANQSIVFKHIQHDLSNINIVNFNIVYAIGNADGAAIDSIIIAGDSGFMLNGKVGLWASIKVEGGLSGTSGDAETDLFVSFYNEDSVDYKAYPLYGYIDYVEIL